MTPSTALAKAPSLADDWTRSEAAEQLRRESNGSLALAGLFFLLRL